MTHRAEQILQPRSFVLSGNEESIVLQSTKPESRLTFLNSISESTFTRTPGIYPRYTFSFSNQGFHLLFTSNAPSTLATFREHPLLPNTRQVVLYGNTLTSNIELLTPALKGIVLQDKNALAPNFFAGFGVDESTVRYQLPSPVHKHVFQAAVYDGANREWMRIQESPTNVVQVGIGTTTMGTAEALSVQGDTKLMGNLVVTGSLNLGNSSFVQVNASTQKLEPSVLPSGVVRLNEQTNKIDEATLPQTFNFQFLKAQKNVGIGTRFPAQKLHVWGSTIVSERLGIGTNTPLSRIHVRESSAVIPALRIDANSGGEGMRVHVNNNTTTPAILVVGTHNGVGIGTSVVNAQNALEVGGNAYIHADATARNLNILNKVTAADLQIAYNPFGTVMSLIKTDANAPIMQSRAKFRFDNGIATSIVNTNGGDRVHFQNASILVDGKGIFPSGTEVGSDMRKKFNITQIRDAESKLRVMHGYTYHLGDGERQGGVMAQEVLETFPEAVNVTDPSYYSVRYHSIVALLLEGYHDLARRVSNLELGRH